MVLSGRTYNEKSGLVVVCPMTSEEKGYPYEAIVGASSVVLVDQIKSLDWRVRNGVRMGKATGTGLGKVSTLLKSVCTSG